MLLDRSGQGKVYQLISRRRFQQMEVLEGQNILVTVSGKKNRVRVYYLSWLKSKILRTDGVSFIIISTVTYRFFLFYFSVQTLLLLFFSNIASRTKKWLDKRWRFTRCCTFLHCQV